jgi:hypothetical protein
VRINLKDTTGQNFQLEKYNKNKQGKAKENKMKNIYRASELIVGQKNDYNILIIENLEVTFFKVYTTTEKLIKSKMVGLMMDEKDFEKVSTMNFEVEDGEYHLILEDKEGEEIARVVAEKIEN